MRFDIKSRLDVCMVLYKQYEYILNTYVSDFYLDHHWNTLPQVWKDFLLDITMEEMGQLLDFSKPFTKKTSPLSLVCLRKLLSMYTLSREQTLLPLLKEPLEKNFMKYFWKNVKLKKRHEIAAMSKVCYKAALQTNCFYIVDVGSGLGHLSRMLSYGYGFNICTFEAQNKLSKLASELDFQFEKILSSKRIKHSSPSKTVHISLRISPDLSPKQFVTIVKNAFKFTGINFRFGIVGLHPCGDLGPTLLNLYNQCQEAVFINVASCCYMKMTLGPSVGAAGFPLGFHCKKANFHLNYLACEVACHAIEKYRDKLTSNNADDLKIHAFRAGLESVLVNIQPELHHQHVGNVKYESDLTFRDYCGRALRNSNLVVTNEQIDYFEDVINKTWKNVVSFYCVRLLLAPLVESVILYDRLFYLEETSNCALLPAFDYNISPRNHVLYATKL